MKVEKRKISSLKGIGEKTEKTASAAGMKAVLAESVSEEGIEQALYHICLLYTSPSPRD